ncbi:aminotransferase class III-fold pyridoxal phosphate-dependent enzyme [Streptomyces sp. NPDC056638]|uniref:aminotransferase class III-fold pyridoxal phosphate-dependent enzyme n=1 Tax=Streptomyces sp. NPDC056638 TaxID=3345887 RepID=UPI0036B00B33
MPKGTPIRPWAVRPVETVRAATGRPGIVVLDHSFHGRTLLTMSLTAKNRPYKRGFRPFVPEVYRAPMAYPYRWGFGAAG